MTQAGLEFEVISPECDENIKECSPEKYVMELSGRKAAAGEQLVREHKQPEDAVVIGADTIVCYDGQILGKPHSEEEAFEMLRKLSRKVHEVYTGVTVISAGKAHCFYERTEVSFYEVTDEELMDYIRTGEPMDKAGAYGIQGRGCFLVEKINGDFFNVVGLPAAHLLRLLKEIL